MDSQKNENILNLALDTSEAEREKSKELNIGFDESTGSWEVIVKYHGELAQLENYGITVEKLIAGYAILTVPETEMKRLDETEEIEYVEKPKRLYFADAKGNTASCLTPAEPIRNSLRGKGVLVAVIDSGIQYERRDFCNYDGTTRILALWDQTLNREFTKQQIDEALLSDNEAERFERIPSVDVTGHGTAVAGIAAGNGGNRGEAYAGVAPESFLIVVKLGSAKRDGFPRTTQLMRALRYVVDKSVEWNMPLAVNLSFGNTYGAHNGTSLLERFIDNIAEIGRTVICVGSGNEAASGGHVSGRVTQNAEEIIELIVGEYETGLSVQLWKEYTDTFEVEIQSPEGQRIRVRTDLTGKQTFLFGNVKLLLYNGEPTPYMTMQELYFDFLPNEGNRYITAGIWIFYLRPMDITVGNYTFYLPSESVRGSMTRFVETTPDVTLTIPSTASRVITVGAYDPVYQSYADFSGRGYLYRNDVNGRMAPFMIKPDLAAPGVNVLAPDRTDGYATYTGTSFATPYVTGAAALLMEWGIVRGMDPFLYGEKVKAYLRKGARKLRGENLYPNAKVGYGALCIRESFPTTFFD